MAENREKTYVVLDVLRHVRPVVLHLRVRADIGGDVVNVQPLERDEVAAEGVVYTNMESALKGEYADMVRKYFMKLVTPRDHKFAALHGAVWSGGSFVYVPKGVHLSIAAATSSRTLW